MIKITRRYVSNSNQEHLEDNFINTFGFTDIPRE